MHGIQNGFTITQPAENIPPAECANYPSATGPENRAKVESQIREEIAQGRYIVTKDKPLVISALGAIPKQDSQDIRLIHDCSRPTGKGVNSYANPEKFHFESIDNAVRHISRGSWMAKVDIKAAYRHVGLNPSEYKLTGIQYKFSGDKDVTFMYDSRLPFGASESVGCLHRISQSVVRAARRRAKRLNCHIMCYLDDFLIIGDSRRACQRAVDILVGILSELGFSLNWDKFCPPSQCIVFLGIEIDSVRCTIRIPSHKLQDIIACVSAWQAKRKATKRELQTLLGKLAWGAKCAKAIRPTFRSLIVLQSRLKKASHRIRIPSHVLQDLQLFHDWCQKFNGVTFLPVSQPVYTVYTDASQTAGAAFFQGDFAYMAWSADLPCLDSASIYVKELAAVLLAVVRWSAAWAGQSIHLLTDNKATAFALKTGRTRCQLANQVLREILWMLALVNCHFTVSYLPSKDNYIADALSRMDNAIFLAQAIKFLMHI